MRRLLIRFSPIICPLLALLTLLVFEAVAGKAYIWRDADGQMHFSDRPPPGGAAEKGVEERDLKEPPPPPPLKNIEKASKNPLEHAVRCTFRLANKRGGGSGFFINGKGLAVTAKHVVKGVTYSMEAELPGHKKPYRVQVLKKDRDHDLALIRVSINRVTPFLEVRDIKTLVPGEPLWAIGNPLLAFRETVTRGTFSRIFPEAEIREELKWKRRQFKYTGDWVQFSASVTGGNSGGPVVDEKGRLVGVVSWGIPAHEALNFAVPSAYILEDFGDYLN
ncbi:MAG: trypsin-like peptidase domain-containing protein [Deltaproteobacteria bacterium]|nr:trypsin-like peptidase domain-containing protein [Deltaproteobacteria bacterium]